MYHYIIEKTDQLHNLGSKMAATRTAIRDRGTSVTAWGGSMTSWKWRYSRRQLRADTERRDRHKGNCDMKMNSSSRQQKRKTAENQNRRQLWYENDQ